MWRRGATNPHIVLENIIARLANGYFANIRSFHAEVRIAPDEAIFCQATVEIAEAILVPLKIADVRLVGALGQLHLQNASKARAIVTPVSAGTGSVDRVIVLLAREQAAPQGAKKQQEDDDQDD